jgi:hypothetical protein
MCSAGALTCLASLCPSHAGKHLGFNDAGASAMSRDPGTTYKSKLSSLMHDYRISKATVYRYLQEAGAATDP